MHIPGFFARLYGFWSSIQLTESGALQYGMQYLHGQVTEASSHKAFGYSVRCVEDLPM